MRSRIAWWPVMAAIVAVAPCRGQLGEVVLGDGARTWKTGGLGREPLRLTVAGGRAVSV